MRSKRYQALLSVVFMYVCAQILLNLQWVTIPRRISRGITDINRIVRLEANTSADRVIPVSGGTRLVKGNFRPSFSLGRENVVSVTTLDSYNEFEYEDFKIQEPNFPRSFDRELFYNFTTGIELLEFRPYNRKRGIVEIIRNGTYSPPFLCGWPSNYTSMHMKSAKFQHYDKVCPLQTPEGNTFQHFLDGLLPKLIQVRDILLDPEMKVMIPSPRASDKRMIRSILDRVGIHLSQIVWATGSAFTADYMVAACIAPPLHPFLWKTARGLLGVHDKLTLPQNKSLIILLTRALSHNGGRMLLNKEEIANYLRNRYGKERVVVFRGGYSLNESIELFGKVHLMIGVHGGALYNVNFAPNTTKVLEIMPYFLNEYPRGLATTIFWSMSRMIGQEYWRLFVKSSGGQNNVVLDMDLLKNTLEMIDR